MGLLTGFLLTSCLQAEVRVLKEPFDAATATTLSLEVPLVGCPEDGVDGKDGVGSVGVEGVEGLPSGVGSVGLERL